MLDVAAGQQSNCCLLCRKCWMLLLIVVICSEENFIVGFCCCLLCWKCYCWMLLLKKNLIDFCSVGSYCWAKNQIVVCSEEDVNVEYFCRKKIKLLLLFRKLNWCCYEESVIFILVCTIIYFKVYSFILLRQRKVSLLDIQFLWLFHLVHWVIIEL